MLNKLVKAVSPNFPNDGRVVRETNDRVAWYMVGGTPLTLYVPPVNYLKTNTMELDRFAEAVNAFAVTDINSKEYDWDNLILKSFTGLECEQGLRALIRAIQNKEVAVDIETRRIEYEDNLLLSIGFAISENECWAFYDIPIKGSNCEGHYSENSYFATYRALCAALQVPTATYIWHNGKFDTNRLKYLCNIDARVDQDTMLRHYACINEKRGTHSLKDLGQLYLQAPKWDDELDKIKREWCRSHKKKLADFMYDDIPTEVLIPYMQRDCIATYRLNNKFKALAREGSEFVYDMLILASKTYGQMELNGVKVDVDYLDDFEFELDMAMIKAQKHLDEVAGKIWNPSKYVKDTGAKSFPDKFNMKSPAQLKWMLSEVLGYQIDSTNATTLDSLIEQCDSGAIKNTDAKEFIEAIGTVRKNNKYMDTYVQGIRSVLCADNRIRCTYNLHGTETGRLSCSDPNMQNIPRDKAVKNIFVAKPGYKLLQLDYSQAELRVLALLSGDEYMIKAYQEGRDFHDAVAEGMFGPNFDKEQRVLAKTINFGIAYGRGPGSIAQKFNKTMGEARAIIDRWYKPMPNVKKWMEIQRKKPILGEPCVTRFGRERHFVVTNDKLNHIQNDYVNTPIQSLASDFTMLSLIQIHNWIQKENIDAKIVITVHDSIVLEVIDDWKIIDKVAQKCTEIMATTPKKYIPECTVPFKADAEVGYSWGALEEWVAKD